MLKMANQQIELYPKSLDKISRDSIDRLATTFVPNEIGSNSKEYVFLAAKILHFKR